MEKNNSRSYIIVTPCKDEGENLPNLVQSMVEQKEKPSLWIIVDDGSIDDTPTTIHEIQKKFDWIQSIQLEKHQRDIGKHYAYVCNMGFNFAIKYCDEHNIKYDYIGIVDADIVLEKDFFNKLIEEFNKNSKLGIASGSIYYYDSSNELVLEKMRDDLPLGCMRLWRKDCFEEAGGYYISHFPDSVSNVSAKLMGWETKLFNHITAIQSRETHSAEGLWKGYIIIGSSDYFRDYHPFFVIAKGFRYLSISPHYLTIPYLYGYFRGFLCRGDKIDNDGIRKYYRHKHKEIIHYYWFKLRNKLMNSSI